MNNCLHLNQKMFRCPLFCLLVFTVLLVFGLFGASWMCRLMNFHLDTFNILVVQSLQTCLRGDIYIFLSFPFETLPKHSCHQVHYWMGQVPLPRLFPLSYQSLTLIPSLPAQRHLKNPDPARSSRPCLKKLLSLSLAVCPSLALSFILLLKHCSFHSRELRTCCHGF